MDDQTLHSQHVLILNAHAMLARAVERRDWAQVCVVLRGLERAVTA